jgi:BASS family bile acid:Na+ symporter
MRAVTVFQLSVPGGAIAVSLSGLLLGVLLFHAGLGADVAELAAIVRKPHAVLAGTVTNLLVPLAFIFILAGALRWWPNPVEAHELVAGLAIVAAMPVAGSSTAWSQHSGGSPALSLGLVVLSTVLSPITTPLALASVRGLASGRLADALDLLSGRGTALLLLVGVVIPSLAGMALRRLFGGPRIARVQPQLKRVNAVVLLLLCYINASASLPQVVARPDWDLLVLTLATVAALCLSAFAAGRCLAKLLRASEAQKRALMFALGMNNNGTGMVLACGALPTLPAVVLPVLAYNLVQHLVAAGVGRSFARASSRPA